MAHASSKRSAVPGKSTSVLPRHALKSMGAGSSGRRCHRGRSSF
jgi:hypothetical protein